jgi:hypothetical protein
VKCLQFIALKIYIHGDGRIVSNLTGNKTFCVRIKPQQLTKSSNMLLLTYLVLIATMIFR